MTAPEIDPNDLATLVVDLDRYQAFTPDDATVVRVCTSSALPVVMWNLAPGQRNDHHLHRTTEHVHVVVEGECEYTLGDLPPRVVRPGQAVLIPALVPHRIRNVSDRRASYLAISSPGPYEKVLVTPE